MKNFKQYILTENVISFNSGALHGQVVFCIMDTEMNDGISHKFFMEQRKFQHYELKNWKALAVKIEQQKRVFKNTLQNIMIDVPIADSDKIEDITHQLMDYGYKKEDIHMTWVLKNYHIDIKKDLGPIKPNDIMLNTGHKDEMMHSILNGEVPENMDGDIKVILRDYEHDVRYGGKLAFSIKGIGHITVKKSGKPIHSGNAIRSTIFSWVSKSKPESSSLTFQSEAQIQLQKDHEQRKIPRLTQPTQPQAAQQAPSQTGERDSSQQQPQSRTRTGSARVTSQKNGMVTIHRRHGGRIGFAFKNANGKIAFTEQEAQKRIEKLKQAFPADNFVTIPYTPHKKRGA